MNVQIISRRIMKKLIFILSFLSLPVFAHGHLDDATLYGSLNLTEEDVSVGAGAIILKKTLNEGLSCTKTTIVYPGAVPSYFCKITTDHLDSTALYDALNLTEIRLLSRPWRKVTKKHILGLSCLKTRYHSDSAPAKYTCWMNLKF
jgi:hypothetical protein